MVWASFSHRFVRRLSLPIAASAPAEGTDKQVIKLSNWRKIPCPSDQRIAYRPKCTVRLRASMLQVLQGNLPAFV